MPWISAPKTSDNGRVAMSMVSRNAIVGTPIFRGSNYGVSQ